MAEEYIYDRKRIVAVILILVIIFGTSFILYALWPKIPAITETQTNSHIIREDDAILAKYHDLFGDTINVDNTTMYRIDIMVGGLYFATRISFTLTLVGNVSILGVAITEYDNEANILIGDNNIDADQRSYFVTTEIGLLNYKVFLFLDILESEYDIYYNIRASG